MTLVKLPAAAGVNIGGDDADVAVAVRAALFVIEADGVADFVDHVTGEQSPTSMGWAAIRTKPTYDEQVVAEARVNRM